MVSGTNTQEARAVDRVLGSVEAALHIVRRDAALSPTGRARAEAELVETIRTLVQLMAAPAADRLF